MNSRPGHSAIVGISFILAGNTHDGWIDLDWTDNHYNAARWAYESTPGVPGRIPTPRDRLPSPSPSALIQ